MFLLIPILLIGSMFKTYDPDLVDCEDEVSCEVDSVPEQTLDKFDVKIQANPSFYELGAK